MRTWDNRIYTGIDSSLAEKTRRRQAVIEQFLEKLLPYSDRAFRLLIGEEHPVSA